MKGTYKGWVFVFQAGFITLFPGWSFFAHCLPWIENYVVK